MVVVDLQLSLFQHSFNFDKEQTVQDHTDWIETLLADSATLEVFGF